MKEGSSDIELWGRVINAERKEKFDLLAEKNVYIVSAYKHLQVISQDEEKRLEYEAREKAVRDYNQIILEAKQLGREEGVLRERTIVKLQKHYHLMENEAKQYYKKFL